jgi:hypothetical protein
MQITKLIFYMQISHMITTEKQHYKAGKMRLKWSHQTTQFSYNKAKNGHATNINYCHIYFYILLYIWVFFELIFFVLLVRMSVLTWNNEVLKRHAFFWRGHHNQPYTGQKQSRKFFMGKKRERSTWIINSFKITLKFESHNLSWSRHEVIISLITN